MLGPLGRVFTLYERAYVQIVPIVSLSKDVLSSVYRKVANDLLELLILMMTLLVLLDACGLDLTPILGRATILLPPVRHT